MTRYILCPECGGKFKLHPEDHTKGFTMRKIPIIARKPENLEIVIHMSIVTEKIPVTILVCDHCNVSIPDGSPAMAVTLWNEEVEGEPGNWEQEYEEL